MSNLAHWGRDKMAPIFSDDILKCIFLNENAWISLQISLTFVPNVRINNLPALVQIMAWRQPGDKPLSGSMMVSLLTHICVIWPQWVNNKALTFFPLTELVLFHLSDCGPQKHELRDHSPTAGPVNRHRIGHDGVQGLDTIHDECLTTRAPSQYEDRLSRVWRFPC